MRRAKSTVLALNPNHTHPPPTFFGRPQYRTYVAPAEQEWRGGKGKSAKPAVGRVLSYWCFSAGIAMRELAASGVRSLLLASGVVRGLAGSLSRMSDERPKHTLPAPSRV